MSGGSAILCAAIYITKTKLGKVSISLPGRAQASV